MTMHNPLSLVLLSYVLPLVTNAPLTLAAYTWPSPQYDALEMLLYEGRRSDSSILSSLVSPCRKRAGTGASVPAEWLRFAFHDMATHNVDDGTGGLDGSIVYELGRPENFGPGFNDTRDDFQAFPNKLISRADVISIGTVMAVATCGGPVIPFRGGRIDVWEAQSSDNTPVPEDDIGTLRESFRKQGFSPAEMIKLTACGHTMGGVRSTDFPQLVPPASNSTAPVIQNFDTTTNFDNAVVTEYLSGNTQNILVVTSNATMASDLRVFSSDNNSTMRGLADKNTFISDCKSLLGRMLDTVASGVTLTSEITLLPAKVNAAQLTFENKKLVFKSSFRLTKPINETVPANRVVTMYWCAAYGSDKNCANRAYSALPVSNITEDTSLISPVTTSLGYTFVRYEYVVPIDPAASISKFWFEVDDKNGKGVTKHNNGGNGYVVNQDSVLFVPMLSRVDYVAVSHATTTTTATADTTTTSSISSPVRKRSSLERRGGPLGPSVPQDRIYSLIVAVKSSFSPSRVYIDATDVATLNFTTRFSATVDLALNSSSYPSMSGYDFYYGRVTSPGMQMLIDVSGVGSGQTLTQNNMQTLLLDNTATFNPANVTMVGGKKSDAVVGAAVVGPGVLAALLTGLLGAFVLLG